MPSAILFAFLGEQPGERAAGRQQALAPAHPHDRLAGARVAEGFFLAGCEQVPVINRQLLACGEVARALDSSPVVRTTLR